MDFSLFSHTTVPQDVKTKHFSFDSNLIEKVIRSRYVPMVKSVRTEINVSFIIRNVEWDHTNQ